MRNLVLAGLMLALVACGGTKSDDSSSSSSSTSSSSSSSSTSSSSNSSASSTSSSSGTAATFVNPLFSDGADPWMQYFNGNYYLVTTTWTSQLVMRKSPTLAGLALQRNPGSFGHTPSVALSVMAYSGRP